tara:strand:+ start:1781 stop:1930 length:150 start_codon:yes stop_codon:yes gene_type:complete
MFVENKIIIKKIKDFINQTFIIFKSINISTECNIISKISKINITFTTGI